MSLHTDKDFNSCASRMYYAVFQSVKLYAVAKEQYDPKADKWKHQNAHRVMNDIIKSKLSALSELYEDMRALRNKADYDPEDVSASEIDTHTVHSMQSIRDVFLKDAIK